MDIIKFISVLLSKIKYLIILPILAAALTFFLTKDIPKQYESNTTIYTGVTSNSGLDVNATKIDKLITQNEYNNILSILRSNALFEEVSLRLLAQHLSITKRQPDIISDESYLKFQNDIPDEIKKLAVKGNVEKTYSNLKKYIKQDENNYLYRLQNYEHPFYSLKAISKIKAEQINSSDLFRLSYNSSDPGVCYNTIQIASEVFISSYGQIKKNFKSSAVKYFQEKLAEIAAKLDASETKLLNFNIDNSIINYYEQTKQVTTQHEEIELRLQTVKMDFEAASSVLKKIDFEISNRFSINLKNVELLRIRRELVHCNNLISNNILDNNADSKLKSIELNNVKISLEKKLELSLDSIYNIENSSQGIDSKKLLSEWLDAVKNYESYKAMLKSMQERQAEFMMQFQRYAPLGANIKRIEREINVFENEYLNVLNNLNIALQNEQNTDLISNMRVIDNAKFPISSLPSKRKLYLIVSALITLIFYIAGLLIIELLDNRIKTPLKLMELTDLELAGAFSIQNNNNNTTSEDITKIATSFIFEKIRLNTNNQVKPYVIQIFSIWNGIGESFVADKIAESITFYGYSVEILDLAKKYNEFASSNNKEDIPEILKHYYRANNYNELLASSEIQPVDFIISIIPSVSKGIENTILITDSQMNLIVYNADLTWTSSDQYNTDKLKTILPIRPFVILTSVSPDNVEEIYGEIYKKRSKFRILVKKQLKRFVS